jgi:hypothetical protein
MPKRKRISTPSLKQGSLVKSQPAPDYDARPPVFSLERVQSGDYCFSVLDQENKAMFAECMFKRKNLTWREIKSSGKHQLGFEKIAKNAIKAPIPPYITEDEDSLLAFRYHGKRAMVGYRIHDVFYVLWFDPNFRLYKHS